MSVKLMSAIGERPLLDETRRRASKLSPRTRRHPGRFENQGTTGGIINVQDVIETYYIRQQEAGVVHDGHRPGYCPTLKVIEPRICSQCGYKGAAIDAHHIHGRKNSDETIDVCANCHREIHAGTRKIK